MFKEIKYLLRKIIKKPLKIGLVTYYYPDKKSGNNGVAIHTYYLSIELAKKGCEVHIFANGDKNSTTSSLIGEGKLVVHRINSKMKTEIKDVVINKRMDYFVFDNKIIDEITKESEREKFDVIHTHGWLTAGAFIAKHLNNTKWVHTFHALEKERLRFMSKEEKRYFQIAQWMETTIHYADAIIAVSNFLKKKAQKEYNIPDNKVFYIPNGVDLDVFNMDKPTQKEKRVAYIGRFSFEKGIDFVEKIFEGLLKNNKDLSVEIVAADAKTPESFKITKEGFENMAKNYPTRFVWHKEPLNREKIAEILKRSE